MFFRRNKRPRTNRPDAQAEARNTEPPMRRLYWLEPADFHRIRPLLERDDYRLEATRVTPCQVLTARDDRIVYAPPAIWNGMCDRQGSWYRDSHRAGQYMVMSIRRLPAYMEPFLDSEMSVSDFMPKELPERTELEGLVASPQYQSQKPSDWEKVRWTESWLMKIMFTFTRFWGRRDNLKKHWLGHRANHANFLARRFTTPFDGESVPYSVTGNASVCSSCAEFFNVIAPGSRKLVRACPGAISISGARRDVYYDVRPRQPGPVDR